MANSRQVIDVTRDSQFCWRASSLVMRLAADRRPGSAEKENEPRYLNQGRSVSTSRIAASLAN